MDEDGLMSSGSGGQKNRNDLLLQYNTPIVDAGSQAGFRRCSHVMSGRKVWTQRACQSNQHGTQEKLVAVTMHIACMHFVKSLV